MRAKRIRTIIEDEAIDGETRQVRGAHSGGNVVDLSVS
jgi:hypothetical protein